MAQGEISALQKVWRHTSLSMAEKYNIYRAIVISRLLYGLQAAWLGKVALRKLDGFNARCLRKMGIAPSYYSRISNKTVLDRLGARSLSNLLLEQQLSYLGTLARRPAGCQACGMVFDQTHHLQTGKSQRRVGCPRLEWAGELFKVLRETLPTTGDFCNEALDASTWRRFTRQFCTGH